LGEPQEHILTDPSALPDPDDKLSVRETAYVAVWWGIVWYIGNWLNNTALGLTSVASMTIIATTSGTWWKRMSEWPYSANGE
jgi:solute carrier family 35 protein F5